MGALDLVVHPATAEGLGVALLEAAAARRPIVATAVGGIPEVIRDGETGLLVPPRDADALARAVLRFSISAMTTGNLRVYRELTGG
jgi:glycosyltransferase involved in cell wall biosynthesis